MNQDQQLVSWMAVFGIIIAVMVVYRGQLSAIIFGPGVQSGSTIIPYPGNPGGLAPLQPTPAPPGQSGQYRVDPNGDLYKWLNGQWTPWGTSAPYNQPVGPT